MRSGHTHVFHSIPALHPRAHAIHDPELIIETKPACAQELLHVEPGTNLELCQQKVVEARSLRSFFGSMLAFCSCSSMYVVLYVHVCQGTACVALACFMRHFLVTKDVF